MEPGKTRPPLGILLCISDAALRDRVREFLGPKTDPPLVPAHEPAVVEALALGGVEARLHKFCKGPRAGGAVLVSDGLVEPDPPSGLAATTACNELFALFGEKSYATIALSPAPGRVADVDRVVGTGCTPDEFRRALQLCLSRLAYLREPAPLDDAQKQELKARVSVRLIVSESDLRKYFALRHEVYQIMCYLDPQIEDNPKHMEIDWFDTRSLHFGAYLDHGQYEELVGTARLISTEPVEDQHRTMVLNAACDDPQLCRLVTEGAIMAKLPVFQSQKLAALLQQLERSEAAVGEVSRVIVRREFRGLGLSESLTQKAARSAQARGMTDLLLECLPVHARVYERAGFRVWPRLRGNVYNINRTMIVMHRGVEDRSILNPPDAGADPGGSTTPPTIPRKYRVPHA